MFPALEFSPAVLGAGTALYQAALEAGHEGIVAKRLTSVYLPGKRSAAWRKIKPRMRDGMDTVVQR
jgi:DNA ligase-1